MRWIALVVLAVAGCSAGPVTADAPPVDAPAVWEACDTRCGPVCDTTSMTVRCTSDDATAPCFGCYPLCTPTGASWNPSIAEAHISDCAPSPGGFDYVCGGSPITTAVTCWRRLP